MRTVFYLLVLTLLYLSWLYKLHYYYQQITCLTE